MFSMGRVLGFALRYKLTSLSTALSLLLAGYYSFRLAQGEYLAYNFGYTSTLSVISYPLMFAATSMILVRRHGVDDVRAFVTSLSTTLSAIWFYELVYHYSFPVYWNYFRPPYFDLSDFRTLFMNTSLSLLILVGRDFIKVRGNVLFIAFMSLFAATYGLWIAIGFTHPDGSSYTPVLIEVENPELVGFVLNRLSKALHIAAWVSLYYHHQSGASRDS